MKSTARILSLILAIVFTFSLSACAAKDAYGGGYYTGLPEGVSPDEPGSAEDGVPENGATEEVITLPSGMITAGAWNDNAHYAMWQALFYQADAETKENGKFYSYTIDNNDWGFNSMKRVKVTVTNNGAAVSGANAAAYDNAGNLRFSAITDASGIAYLFVTEDEGTIRISNGAETKDVPFAADQRELTVELASTVEKRNVIEIMFVVDVTGSMGDELRFLKAELADVISKIAQNDTNAVIKLALLFYRDTDDNVPFDYYDFTDVTTQAGMAAQQAALDKQKPDGGGDYPEAVDTALEMAINKQWSTGATTKLIFHVLDAPAHTGTSHEMKFNSAVLSAAAKGIRICPILCSGAAELTEYTMRQAAIYTGGTFIFVTDDSGIGGAHHDPGLPNATVELLNSMLVRLVKGYHTGTFDSPIYWKDDPALNVK